MRPHSLRGNPKCPFGELEWDRYYWKYRDGFSSYEQEYWGQVKDPDGNMRDLLSEEERIKQIENSKFIIEQINNILPGRILDVGCGPGYLLSAISSKWDKFGIDVSDIALNYAKQYCKIQKGKLIELGLKSAYFDIVVMSKILEHLEDPISYVQECYRVLKPNGVLIIGTPDFDSGCARWFGKNYRMLCDKGHISLFTSYSLIKMLEDFQFEVQELEFPFFEENLFTAENLLRMLDRAKISPPFYGNYMIVVACKK